MPAVKPIPLRAAKPTKGPYFFPVRTITIRPTDLGDLPPDVRYDPWTGTVTATTVSPPPPGSISIAGRAG